MTSEGHPYAVFQRALAKRNASVAWSVAAELDYVSLEDALAVSLLVAGQPTRFDRAASRWIARYLDEEPGITLEELRLTAELLTALPGRHRSAAAGALGQLFARRGRADLAAVVDSFDGGYRST